jgi:hypothetical protein
MSKEKYIPSFRGPLYKEKIIWKISGSVSQQDIRRNRGRKKLSFKESFSRAEWTEAKTLIGTNRKGVVVFISSRALSLFLRQDTSFLPPEEISSH